MSSLRPADCEIHSGGPRRAACRRRASTPSAPPAEAPPHRGSVSRPRVLLRKSPFICCLWLLPHVSRVCRRAELTRALNTRPSVLPPLRSPSDTLQGPGAAGGCSEVLHTLPGPESQFGLSWDPVILTTSDLRKAPHASSWTWSYSHIRPAQLQVRVPRGVPPSWSVCRRRTGAGMASSSPGLRVSSSFWHDSSGPLAVITQHHAARTTRHERCFLPDSRDRRGYLRSRDKAHVPAVQEEWNVPGAWAAPSRCLRSSPGSN